MKIVRIKAGLGNQMFQYAFYKAVIKRYGASKIDIDAFTTKKFHQGYEIEKIFDVNPEICSKNERKKLSNLGSDPISKFKLKIFGRKNSEYVEKHFEYSDEVFNLKEEYIYFDGNWQSEKYFFDIKDQIREEFTFKNKLDEKNHSVANYIRSNNSISLHVRRGDYLKKPLFKGGCSIDYYNKAVNLLTDKIDNPLFFIFSDDMDWCKENIIIEGHEVVYVDWNTGENSYLDMQLISYCKHNIMANSSFSWWGAWLNNNDSKIIIAPSKWFNSEDIDCSDLLPEEWVKI